MAPQAQTPPSLLEGFVQLPVDGTGKQLRAFPVMVYEQQVDGTFQQFTAYQQVLMIADALGNVLGTSSAPFPVSDGETQNRLDAIYDVLLEIRDALQDNE